jgi:four helix bundle protein
MFIHWPADVKNYGRSGGVQGAGGRDARAPCSRTVRRVHAAGSFVQSALRAKGWRGVSEGTARAKASRMCAHRYEDLDAWRLANEVKVKAYELIDTSPARHDFKFRDQLRECLNSATANIAEGFGYYDHGLFAKHVRIALASETETLNHLADGVQRGYWDANRVASLEQLTKRAIRVATRFLSYLETSDAPHKWTKRNRARRPR